jgi:hypothetical protein
LARRRFSASLADRSASRASNTEITRVVARNMNVKPPTAAASQTLLMACGLTVQTLSGAKMAAAMPV